MNQSTSLRLKAGINNSYAQAGLMGYIMNGAGMSENGMASTKTILFFDAETTGVPKNYKAPISDFANWPRLVQLGWAIYGADGMEINADEMIIKPDGFVIPPEAVNIHGITTAVAREKGINLSDVLSKFSDDLVSVPLLVGHNIEFDENIVGCEFLRCNMKNMFPSKKRMCTMKLSVDYCKLPGPYGNKWSKLDELHNILLHTNMDGRQHTALADVRATARCFFKLHKLGVIRYSI